MPTRRLDPRGRTGMTLSALAATTLMIAGCSAASDTVVDHTDDTTNAATDEVTLTNCGEDTSFAAPAERIVATSNAANIGTLLRIGAIDRIAAMSMTTGNNELMNELYSVDVDNIPRLQSPISMEAIVAEEPDLLIGSYSGLFAGATGVTRETAADRDIATYVISDSCRQNPDDPESPLGTMDPWDAVRSDLANYGTLTDGVEAADSALAELDDRLAALAAAPGADDAPSILLFDSGETDVYTSGRNGPPQGIIDAAGAANVFDTEDTTWFRASWEAVAEREPDAIVVMDYNSDNPDEVEQKLATIRSQAALANTTAVAENRIIILPLLMFTSGYPNIEAAEQLRAGLEDLGLLPESGITGTIDLS